MSILSFIKKEFVSLQTFVSNLFKTAETDYKNLQPEIKADLKTSVQAIEVIKTNLEKPENEIVLAVEAAVGTVYTQNIISVLGDVADDLGLAEQVVDGQVTPLAAIVQMLRPLQGKKWMDTVLNFAEYTAINLIGGNLLTRSMAKLLIQFIKDKYFATPAPVAVAVTPVALANAGVATTEPANLSTQQTYLNKNS